jgi:RNA polymerase sigma-70 factor (ECF subfamily)
MITALTAEQRIFAERHHRLIHTFLRSRWLPESEYYDVVVFGYLEAVEKYLKSHVLRRRYRFSTVAFVKMRDALFDERIRQNRLKRRGVTVNLNALRHADPHLYAQDSRVTAFELRRLMLEMSEWLSPHEMAVIRLRVYGYSPWEISRKLKIPPTAVHDLVRSAHDTVLAICA